jgi:hypothetical protein
MIFFTSQSVISVGLLLVLNLKVASLSGALKIPNLEQQDIRKLSHEGEVIQVENVRSRKHSKQASPHSPSDIDITKLTIDGNLPNVTSGRMPDGFISAIDGKHKHDRTPCGTPGPTQEDMAMANKVINNWIQKDPSISSLADESTISIGTYFHVITSGTLGQLSDEMIQKQFDLLNNDFAGSGFTFFLLGVDCINNSSWYSNNYGDTFDKEMKTALHKGGNPLGPFIF